jgi:mannosyltransferase OCH1-like enzyme
MASKIDRIKKQIDVSIKKGDLLDKAVCAFLIKLGFSNDKLQTLEVRNRKYLYVKKKYAHVIDKFAEYPAFENEREKIIWVLWLQGEDEAPEIVRKCIRSIREHNSGYEVRVLDSTTMLDYVELPDYIISKWKKGMISNTHISDIVRTDLLIRHGGIWLDATTYLTDELPNYVLKSDFFVYKRGMTRDKTAVANNWLISSNYSARLLLCVREILFEYWKYENKIKEYFLWQICITIAIEKYPEDWNRVIWVPDVLPEMMRWNIFNSFKGDYWNEIVNLTSIHKLSYKIDLPDNISGTIYEHIIKEE